MQPNTETDPPPVTERDGGISEASLVMAPPAAIEPAAETAPLMQANVDPTLQPVTVPPDLQALIEAAEKARLLEDELSKAIAEFQAAMQKVSTIDSALADMLLRLDNLESIIKGKIANVFNRHFGGLNN